MGLTIRAETTDDYPHIYRITEAAFGQSNEAVLVDLLRAAEHFDPELSLVAEKDGAVVGHVLFYPMDIELDSGGAYEVLSLAPVSVAPEHQRKGIGARLIREGLARGRECGYPAVVLVGHPDYYPRFGFRRASEWELRLPFEAPDEAFMAMELVPRALADKAGVVRYPPQFAEV
jgi:putative acetyltransferase